MKKLLLILLLLYVNLIANTVDTPISILGFTQKEALHASGDYVGYNACSLEHIQGDMANRWCHGAFVKVVESTLVKDFNINKYVANLLAASVFLPKEYLVDLHPSPGDLSIIDFPLYVDSEAIVELTLFGDGVFYIKINKKF